MERFHVAIKTNVIMELAGIVSLIFLRIAAMKYAQFRKIRCAYEKISLKKWRRIRYNLPERSSYLYIPAYLLRLRSKASYKDKNGFHETHAIINI